MHEREKKKTEELTIPRSSNSRTLGARLTGKEEPVVNHCRFVQLLLMSSHHCFIHEISFIWMISWYGTNCVVLGKTCLFFFLEKI
jgi:hypothetical protein